MEPMRCLNCFKVCSLGENEDCFWTNDASGNHPQWKSTKEVLSSVFAKCSIKISTDKRQLLFCDGCRNSFTTFIDSRNEFLGRTKRSSCVDSICQNETTITEKMLHLDCVKRLKKKKKNKSQFSDGRVNIVRNKNVGTPFMIRKRRKSITKIPPLLLEYCTKCGHKLKTGIEIAAHAVMCGSSVNTIVEKNLSMSEGNELEIDKGMEIENKGNGLDPSIHYIEINCKTVRRIAESSCDAKIDKIQTINKVENVINSDINEKNVERLYKTTLLEDINAESACKTKIDKIQTIQLEDVTNSDIHGKNIEGLVKKTILEDVNVESTCKTEIDKKHAFNKREDVVNADFKNLGKLNKALRCVKCEKTFFSEKKFNLHSLLKHPNPFKCNYCDIAYKTEKDISMLRHHLISSHNGTRDAIAAKANQSYFEERQQFIKMKAKWMACKICLATFRTYRQLLVHEVFEHYGQRNCDVCSKDFDCSEHFQFHLGSYSHIQRKEEKCTLCKKSFRDTFDFLWHFKTTHKSKKSNKDTTNFSCEICRQQFSLGYELRSHYRWIHSNTSKKKGEMESHFNSKLNDLHPKKCQQLKECTVCGFEFKSSIQIAAHFVLCGPSVLNNHIQRNNPSHILNTNKQNKNNVHDVVNIEIEAKQSC